MQHAQRSRLMPLAIVACCVACTFTTLWLVRADDQPPLDVANPRYLDFGTVWEAAGFAWELPIQNVSSKTVTVSELATSCGCTSVTPTRFQLRPGETTKLQFNFNLLASRPPGDMYDFSVDLMTRNTPGPFFHCTIRGRVRTPVTLTPRAFHFVGADAVIHGSSAPSKSLNVAANYDELTITPEYDKALGLVTLSPVEGHKGRWILRLSPRPDLPPGPLSSTITLLISDATGSELTRIPVPVHGMVHSDIEVLPGAVHLGVQSHGTIVTESVTLESQRGIAFQLEWYRDASAGCTVAELNPSPSARHVVQIATPIATRGESTATAVLAVVLPSGIKDRIEIPILYVGK